MSDKKLVWIILGLVFMFAVILMPTPAGLSVAGQRVLAILLFAVIMWVSEAISYPVSAIAIVALMLIFLGFAPPGLAPGPILGTAKAIPVALSGFTNTGWVLVAAGLFMAACILSTGLEKRVALTILRIVGTKTNSIFAGMILVMLVFTFFIPSISARSATITPIAMGLIAAFGVDKKSQFARSMLVCVALSSNISGIALLSGGAPNPVAASFIAKATGHTISWMDWFMYGMPFALILSIILYFFLTRMTKFEFKEVPGGKETVAKELAALGPMSSNERKIGIILLLTIVFWATEAIHKVDANSVAVCSVLFMFFPYTGIANWKDIVNRVDWGTILLFGAGISLGEVLLSSGAAIWLAQNSLGALGVGKMPPFMMMVVITIALVIIRVAFASITSATAALIPTVLGFLVSLQNASLPVWGMALVSAYTVYFAFLLPVNSPQAMIPYATGTFETKDMARIGLPLMIVSIGLLLLFYATYWHWLGIV